MAEKQQNHRIGMEKVIIPGQIEISKTGQKYALTLGIIGLLGDAILGIFGNPCVAVTIGGTTVVSLVGTFIYGKHKENPITEEKKD